MKAKEINGKIQVFGTIPNSYGNVQNGYATLTERHEDDGFLDVVVPVILENQILGELYQVENYFTYEVIDTPAKTQDEIDAELEDYEFNLYLKRKQDGENLCLRLSAEFRLRKQSGKITEEVHYILEEAFTPVRNELMFGQWKKGFELLEEIGFMKVGIELYEKLHTKIYNYISENY